MSTSRTREKADGELFKSTGIDDNATSNAITIDSSERVVIGATVQAAQNAVTISSAGYVQARATGVAGYFDRIGSDGSVLEVRKDGSSVGSIGSKVGNLTIGNGDTGLYFAAGANAIYPYNTTTQADRDGAIDLGYSSIRYKDLYLSGGVYLGGTGAANKLDDYEEGTWTPATNCLTISAGDIRVANYTKIGNLVTVQVYMDDLGSTGNGNHAVFTGLPFQSVASGWSCGVLSHSGSNNVVTNPYARVSAGTAQVDLKKDNDTIMVGTEVDASHIIFTISYHTN